MADSALQELARRIEEAIRKADYSTLEEFAHVIGIPKSTLSRLLNGKADPRLSTLRKISDGLGIDLGQLLTGMDSVSCLPAKKAEHLELHLKVPAGHRAPTWLKRLLQQSNESS